MAELIIYRHGEKITVPFEGAVLLDTLLEKAGIRTPHPCGGRGSCGKCSVELSGAVSEPNEAEKRAGVRLSCQAMILGDAAVILPDENTDQQIETATGE